jgi:hypothetical protein
MSLFAALEIGAHWKSLWIPAAEGHATSARRKYGFTAAVAFCAAPLIEAATTGVSKGQGINSGSVSEVSVLKCGAKSTARDSSMLDLKSPIAAALREVNDTRWAAF